MRAHLLWLQAVIIYHVSVASFASSGQPAGESTDQISLAYVVFTSVVFLQVGRFYFAKLIVTDCASLQMLTLVLIVRAPTAYNFIVIAGCGALFVGAVAVRDALPSASSAGMLAYAAAGGAAAPTVILAVAVAALPWWAASVFANAATS